MPLSLASLAPSLVKAAVKGRLPHGIGLARMLELPPGWARQSPLGCTLTSMSSWVERAITEYAQMSQAATKCTKIIAESLAQWTAKKSRTDRAIAAVPQSQGEQSELPAVDGQTAS
jgi:hypothetical protein